MVSRPPQRAMFSESAMPASRAAIELGQNGAVGQREIDRDEGKVPRDRNMGSNLY